MSKVLIKSICITLLIILLTIVFSPYANAGIIDSGSKFLKRGADRRCL